jgi:hypothetical protein
MNLRENSIKNYRLTTKSIESGLMHADNIAGIYYPTNEDSHNYNVNQPCENLPVPPSTFWHWYAKDEAGYLSGGKAQAKRFTQAAVQAGFEFKLG